LRPVRLARAAFDAGSFLVRYAYDALKDSARRARDPERRTRRRARLRRFATFYRMPIERIRALDALKLAPVGASLSRLARALYIDRLVLMALVVGGVLATNAIASDVGSVLASAAILGAGVVAWRWLASTRPAADVHPFMAAIARRIARLTGARVVVFGHTHQPILERAGHRAHWLNPGSWEHLPRQSLHADNESCNCHARYAVITGRDESTRAQLMRWCRRRQAPVDLGPSGDVQTPVAGLAPAHAVPLERDAAGVVGTRVDL
jgi:UDP-2,3-diacylglucosamine pyrophosphatase LpxH